MSDMKKTVFLRGKAFWCKLLEDQLHLNYGKDGKEWSVDFSPNDEGKAVLKGLKVDDRLKNKDNELGDYLTLRLKEFRKDDKPNDKPKIVDGRGDPWPQDKRIGNGSDVDVKLNWVDYGPGKKAGLYLQSMRVLDWIPYEGGGFPEIDSDDEYFGKAITFPVGGGSVAQAVEAAWGTDDLDDDIPE